MFNLNKSKPNNYTNKGSMHKKTSCKQYAMQIEIFFLRNCNEIHSNMICFKRTIKNERERKMKEPYSGVSGVPFIILRLTFLTQAKTFPLVPSSTFTFG